MHSTALFRFLFSKHYLIFISHTPLQRILWEHLRVSNCSLLVRNWRIITFLLWQISEVVGPESEDLDLITILSELADIAAEIVRLHIFFPQFVSSSARRRRVPSERRRGPQSRPVKRELSSQLSHFEPLSCTFRLFEDVCVVCSVSLWQRIKCSDCFVYCTKSNKLCCCLRWKQDSGPSFQEKTLTGLVVESHFSFQDLWWYSILYYPKDWLRGHKAGGLQSWPSH